MSAKHTPGPWRITDDGRIVCYPESLETGVLSSQLPDGEKEANAHLIATAPDLTDHGRFLLNRLEEFEHELLDDEVAREFMGHVSPAIARFRDAIAKAEGSSHA